MERPDTIYFFLSSRGGTIDSAITLYNFLQSLPVEIVMHNNGSVDSSANIIFLAGARRYAFPQSSFLFHGSTWHFPSGNVDGIDVTRSQLSEALSQLTNGEELMRKIIVERTKLTLEVVNGLFLEGAKRNSEFALSNGVVHEIKDLRLPATTSIYTIPDR
jgi:ATP-dependent Clp protease protease subunit